jgi:hypothetical protein
MKVNKPPIEHTLGTSTSQSSISTQGAATPRQSSPLRNVLATRSRSPSLDGGAHAMQQHGAPAFQTSNATRPASGQAESGKVFTNDSTEPKFYPLVDGIKNQDDKYVYMTHGTPIHNVPSIMEAGLDPNFGGGKNGISAKEDFRNNDSNGMLKFGHDPNVALKYAKQAAESYDAPGVQLEARIPIEKFESTFGSGVRPASGQVWRPETGGENFPPHMTADYVASMKPAMPMDPHGNSIWSSETNIPIDPKDVRVVGVSVPAGQAYDASQLKTSYGDHVSGAGINPQQPAEIDPRHEAEDAALRAAEEGRSSF